jgi:DNA-directed RNA polymerase specialized sigma24 family protein
MTGSVAEAEELTQEVFVHVSRNLETFLEDDGLFYSAPPLDR